MIQALAPWCLAKVPIHEGTTGLKILKKEGVKCLVSMSCLHVCQSLRTRHLAGSSHRFGNCSSFPGTHSRAMKVQQVHGKSETSCKCWIFSKVSWGPASFSGQLLGSGAQPSFQCPLRPALLGLQQPSVFPSCGPSQACVPAPPLSLDASLGPIITRRRALPPTTPP